MTDIVDPVTRSRMMANVRSTNTRPEQLVRSLLHTRGLRFARGKSTLPGRPDIVLPKWKVAVFVNGCFWHMHDCHLFRMPATNIKFWETKLATNRERDTRNTASILASGWKVLTIWECALRGSEALQGLELQMNEVVLWIRSHAKENCCELLGSDIKFRISEHEGY